MLEVSAKPPISFTNKICISCLYFTGTNTDAVILQSTKSTNAADCIVASHKALTTPDVTSGIRTALETVLNQSGINKNDIAYLSIGTTREIIIYQFRCEDYS